jgi:hypothetical protein
LEIHNEKDGQRIFHSGTRYDWYILKNTENENKTTIKFQKLDNEKDAVMLSINTKNIEFIPNAQHNLINELLATKTQKQCDVIYSRSEYGTDKKWVSRDKSKEFKYPCVYTINSKNQIKLFYSNIIKRHFGISKLIWSNGSIKSIGSIIDTTGKYGLTQFAYAIIDDPQNLEQLKVAFDSDNFRELMESCAVGQYMVNHRIIPLFRHDWWKHKLFHL